MNTSHAAVNKQVPHIHTIKGTHQATWEDGDYAAFARFMEPGAIEVLDGWRIPPGQQLLDIGCGAVQTAIPAAKAGIRVTGVDIAGNLIAHARRRAAEARLTVQFDVGDAEALPYEGSTFDVVTSMFGAMFAPRPGAKATVTRTTQVKTCFVSRSSGICR